MDGGGQHPLLRIQRRIQDQLRHAQHAVHGRADLVTHVGQEFRLGAAGRLGRQAGLVPLLRQGGHLQRLVLQGGLGPAPLHHLDFQPGDGGCPFLQQHLLLMEAELLAQGAAQGLGHHLQQGHVLGREGIRLRAHDLQHADHTARLGQGRADHGAHPHHAAGVAVHAVIGLAVPAHQDLLGLDAIAGQAALAFQAHTDELRHGPAGGAIDHVLALRQFDHGTFGVHQALQAVHHRLHEGIQVQVGIGQQGLGEHHFAQALHLMLQRTDAVRLGLRPGHACLFHAQAIEPSHTQAPLYVHLALQTAFKLGRKDYLWQ
ncbi:hypothetical protein AZA_89786 [Nitrospirillum viridazoti Y2]|nr:hypothetical protein AZA_89786 [Nitrospirillum amazonense Y2]